MNFSFQRPYKVCNLALRGFATAALRQVLTPHYDFPNSKFEKSDLKTRLKAAGAEILPFFLASMAFEIQFNFCGECNE